MKIKVVLLFKSGSREILEIDWDEDAGPPRADLVKNLGQTGLVTVDGRLVSWNAGHVDFIKVDGQFDEMVTGQARDEEPREPREGQCGNCKTAMWFEYVKGKWVGQCPQCASEMVSDQE
jgi:hypothetical protein